MPFSVHEPWAAIAATEIVGVREGRGQPAVTEDQNTTWYIRRTSPCLFLPAAE
jgi:hypothetical protein